MRDFGFLSLLVLRHAAATSFYDNPEQDVLYNQQPVDDDTGVNWPQEELQKRWGNDWAFTGISTFAHLPYTRCLTSPDEKFDVAIVGAPFDTAVSYRPGARFGPRAIRAASARQMPLRAYNPRSDLDPYGTPLKIIDCGDIPVTPFDNALALQQMTKAFTQLGSRETNASTLLTSSSSSSSSLKWPHPKLITLGGDHSIALAALRGLNAIYKQPVAVVHFDAHLDTWVPTTRYGASWPESKSQQSHFTHGSMFWMASEEGLILNGSSAHAGLRTRLAGPQDWVDDDRQGFLRISADDIDEIGTRGVIDQILERVGTEKPVYLSLDIDVVDPGLAPGTGTPEPGGWTSREVIRILRGIEGLNVVGADVVEVAPAYDGAGEQTALTAAQIVFEMLTSIVRRGVKELELAEDRPRAGPGKGKAKTEL